MRATVLGVLLPAAFALALAGCSSSGDGGGADTRRLRVLAASSLTEVFEELGRSFEAAHDEVEVTFTFGGSSTLAQQVEDGAPADVFAAADEQSMRAVLEGGNADGPAVVVARNRLAILVERGNPKDVAVIGDLARPDVLAVLCAPEVPCGRLARAALDDAGVHLEAASLEENVKAVVSKVLLGEADAGIVYASDVRAAGDRGHGIGMEGAPEAVHPMVVLRSAADAGLARQWVDHVLSAPGQRVLAAHGFLPR